MNTQTGEVVTAVQKAKEVRRRMRQLGAPAKRKCSRRFLICTNGSSGWNASAQQQGRAEKQR